MLCHVLILRCFVSRVVSHDQLTRAIERRSEPEWLIQARAAEGILNTSSLAVNVNVNVRCCCCHVVDVACIAVSLLLVELSGTSNTTVVVDVILLCYLCCLMLYYVLCGC